MPTPNQPPSPNNSSPHPGPSRWRRIYDAAIDTTLDWWDRRPSFFDLYYVRIPAAMLALAGVIHTADETFDWHIADRMAAVEVDAKDNPAEQIYDRVVREIGRMASEK